MTYALAARLLGAPGIVALSMSAAGAEARPCPIANVALALVLKTMPGALAVSTARRRDADSGEPIVRNTIDYANGTTIVLEQQNCQIGNVRLTLLSPHEMPPVAELRQAGRVLAVTPMWKRYFARTDAAAVVAREPQSVEFRAKGDAAAFSYAAGSRFSAAGEQSEAIVSFMHTDAYAGQYRSMFSIYIGVGGA